MDHGAGLLQQVIDHEQQLVYQALWEPPSAMGKTVMPRIDGELTFREIAEEQRWPLGTVLWRMKEAERRLAKRLGALERRCTV